MVRPRGEERIPNLERRIKAAAWRQVEKQGGAAVSLRGIARDLGIAAPSIYNYYPTRNDMLSALACEALKSLRDYQVRAVEAVPAHDGSRRLVSLGAAYRDWAIRHPQRYQLIFGTPIPEYEIPPEAARPSAAWALLPLIETLQALAEAGQLRLDRLPPHPALNNSMRAAWQSSMRGTGANFEVEVLYLAYVIWTRVHGLVSLELGRQVPTFIPNPGRIYRREIESIVIQYL